ncbi:MAG: sodium-dependent transporter [Peptoniphilaceae bacterium]|nr:sodium-dependent transporter [Peptoniphilaceae bacterium]MDY6019027.1 sodium-dependent transporter [Anaerococcus sp.]
MERKGFNSSFGMIMAAVGSAVGLGNIWRFPYIVGTNGGGAFLLVYVIICIVLGVPILISEILIGRRAKSDSIDSFKKLAPGKKWYISGIIAVAASFLILSFYSVVAGWSLEYIIKSIGNEFAGKSPDQIAGLFTGFISSPVKPIIWTFVFMLLTMLIVKSGVAEGIEKVSKILIPLLLLIVILLGVRGITLQGGKEGLKFLFYPDFSNFTMEGFLAALGHSFFTLSLGMAIMTTYGSYVSDDDDIIKSAFTVAFFDTLIAILAGIAIFTSVFTFGLDPTQGAGLVFVTLPNVFPLMPGGYLFGIAFFVLLALAALTSTISLLESSVAFGIDSLKLTRKKASILAALAIFLLSILSSLSNEENSVLHIAGLSFFDFLDKLTSNYMLTIAAFIEIIFLGWFYDKNEVFDELTNHNKIEQKAFKAYYVALKYIAPVAMILIFLTSIGVLHSA